MKPLHFSKSHAWLAVIVALFMGAQLTGQNVIEGWDFEGEDDIPAGFVNIDVDQTTPANEAWSGDNGPSQWILTGRPNADNAGNLAVSAISWLDPLGMADDWLITPGVDLTNSTTAFLSLNYNQQQNDWPDGFRVLISTTGNDISNFPDANVLFEVGSGCSNNGQSVASDPFWDCHCDAACPDDFTANWGNVLVDVSAYVGQEVHIAVHHNSNDQYALFIDDITIFEPVANEAGITAAVPPSGFAVAPAAFFSGLDFKATVSNNGSAALTDVRLKVTIDDVSGDDPVMVAELDGAASATASIAPSATIEVVNTDTFNFTEEGLYVITYEVTAAEGDSDPANNFAAFPYMVNEGMLGKAGVFPDLADPANPGILSFEDQSFTLWGGVDDTATEGLFGYYFDVPTTYSMSGAAFDVGFDETAGVGYDPTTDIRIALIDTTGSGGDRTLWTSAPHLVATTGPLMGLTPNQFTSAFWSCPVDLQPGINYLLAYHQVGAGDGGFVYNGYYFNSGAVFADGELSDPNGLLPPGQPTIHAVFGDAQPLESVMAVAATSGLTVDFSADVVGSACDYAWDFGDGNTGAGPSATHTFAAEGDYEICVDASNDSGDALQDCITVSVACALEVIAGEVTASSIEVVASNGTEPFTYEWSDGQTSSTAIELEPGVDYTVTVTDASGCMASYTGASGSCTISLSVSVIDSGSALAAIDGAEGDVTYTWSNTTTGEEITNDQAFQDGLPAGSYTVTATDESNCSASTSVDIVGTGIEGIAGVTGFSLLPNPTNGFVNLSLDLEANAVVAMDLYTVDGKMIRQIASGNVSQINETLDLSGLSAGLYLVKIAIDNNVVAEKLIIE